VRRRVLSAAPGSCRRLQTWRGGEGDIRLSTDDGPASSSFITNDDDDEEELEPARAVPGPRSAPHDSAAGTPAAARLAL
jgi:hypothetical protein